MNLKKVANKKARGDLTLRPGDHVTVFISGKGSVPASLIVDKDGKLIVNCTDYDAIKEIRGIGIAKKVEGFPKINLDTLPEMEGVPIVDIPPACPNCHSTQFSVTQADPFWPPHWENGVFGLANCRGCQTPFLVRLKPELQVSIRALLKKKAGLDSQTCSKVLNALFR